MLCKNAFSMEPCHSERSEEFSYSVIRTNKKQLEGWWYRCLLVNIGGRFGLF